jgi:hypothetical protein
MKKILILMAAALMVLAPMSAQTRREIRDAKKNAAASVKQLKKDGYKKILELGDPQTILEKYFLKVNEGCRQVVGTAEDCITLNLAKITAITNAANEYASYAGGIVRGRIASSASKITERETLTDQQIDNIIASFERLVQTRINGQLVPYVTAYKTQKDLTSVRIYCLVDISSALKARKEALELALAEQSLAEEYGSQVAEWIDEGFDKLN